MNEVSLKFLEKAEKARRASAVALTCHDFETAASIAYYGLFYTAQALLRDSEVRLSWNRRDLAIYGGSSK